MSDPCLSHGMVPACYGFASQGFGSGGAIGLASVRSCKKLSPCLIKPVPAGSKTDPPLGKVVAPLGQHV